MCNRFKIESRFFRFLKCPWFWLVVFFQLHFFITNSNKCEIRSYVEIKSVAYKMANRMKVRFKVSDVWLGRFGKRRDIASRRIFYECVSTRTEGTFGVKR